MPFDELRWVGLVLVARYLVLGIRNVLASAEPANILRLVPSLGPNAWLHSYLVQAGRLGKIQNVEFDSVYLLVGMQRHVSVDDLKVIPLRVSFGVQVIF